MVNQLIQTVGLGVAGIDPLGAMLLFSVIRTGAGRINIIALTASSFFTTVVAGVVIADASSRVVGSAPLETLSEPGAIWAYLEIGVAVLIGYWLVQRLIDKRDFVKKEKKQHLLGGTVFAYILAGAVFSVTAVIDPTFLATVVVVADANDVFINIIAFTIWTVISQFMLFALFVAYLAGVDQHLVGATMLLWQRHKHLFQGILHAFSALAVLLLLADAIYYIMNGSDFSW